LSLTLGTNMAPMWPEVPWISRFVLPLLLGLAGRTVEA